MTKRSIYLLCGAALIGAALTAQTREMVSAMVFGPVMLLPGQSVKGCSNNLFGDSVVGVRLSVLDSATGAIVGTPQDLRVVPGGGACANSAPNPTGAIQSVVVVLSVPITDYWRGARSTLSNSVQLIDAQGRLLSFLPAVQFNAVEQSNPNR